MGNSTTIPEIPLSIPENSQVYEKTASNNDNFDQRWKCFIDSLDVNAEKIRLIDQLPLQRKLELLLNYEVTTVKFSPVDCVERIRSAKLSQIAVSKKKQDHEDFRKIFTSAEVSLRTNNIEWVLAFLDNQGLEAIIKFMGESLKFLSKSDTFRSTLCDATQRRPSLVTDEFATSSLAHSGSKDSPSKLKTMREINEKDKLSTPYTPNFSLSRTKSSSPTLRHHNVPVFGSLASDSLKDCLHLCLKCFKIILNNQSGCTKAFENSEVIEIITFCLLHPNYLTKALALDLLSAICLIEGGHGRVLKAFDYFRLTIGENASFETLMNDFRVHEDLPFDQYALEYSVACIQFINIVVHSPENINLRVYLQYGFHLLGLEGFLRTLQARPGDKLNRHVDAYMNNLVNCSLLLDDAEAKEVAVEEVAHLKTALEASENSARQAAVSFKQRDLALSELVESLRSKIRDINVATGIQETSSKRIQELDFSLAAAHRQIQRLQDAMAMVQTEALTTGKRSVCNMTTSTTLPLGFGAQDACIRVEKARRKSEENEGVSGDRKSFYSASLNLSPAVRSSLHSTSSSSTPPSRSSSTSIGNTPVNFGTFSRKSGSVGDKPRQGIISCTLISQISDLGSARKVFANVSSLLSLLASKLLQSPRPPSPSPALPQPDWHSLSTAVTHCPSNSSFYRTGDPKSVTQLTMVLPDPWASCLASADRQFKFSSSSSDSVVKDMEERILFWLVTTNMMTEATLQKMSDEHCSSLDFTVESLPITISLLGVNLNPFTATRLFSVVSAVVDRDTGKDRRLTACFDALERLLRESTIAREVADIGRVVNDTASWNWPLLQAYLRVNLLPFIFSRSMEVLVEQLSNLSNCCNSIVVSDKLPTILRTAESLTGALLAKPDFPTLELSSLSTLVDWSMMMRRSTSKVENGTESPRQVHHGSENSSVATSTLFSSTHRAKSFLEALYKAVELNDPDKLDWTCDIVYLDTASRILPSYIHDRIRELEYDLSLRDALFPAPQLTGNLQYLSTDAWGRLGDLKGILAEVEILLGAAAFQLYSATGSKGMLSSSYAQTEHGTFSDRDFSAELVSLARFYSAFKKLTSDSEKRRRGQIKASSCKVTSHRRNGHQRSSESKVVKDGHHHDKQDGDKKRHAARHLNTVGIMDNILAGLEPEPLYADIHKSQSKPSNS